MNTGQLNYHLKVLGNLILKNPVTGKYILSEEGLVALNMNQKSISSTNNGSTMAISTGASRNLEGGVLAEVIVTFVILSAFTYYVLFYLGITKILPVISIIITWAIVVFFIWRGDFYQVKDEKSLQHVGRGGE